MKGMYGMDGRVTYRRLVEGDRDAVAAIFVEAYYNQLRGLDPDRAGLEAMFRGAFLLDHFTGAFDGDELVGFFALSTEAERSVAVRKDDVYARMRGVKRWFACAALRKEFGHPVRLREPGYYLECVAVKPSRQGRGLATGLMRHAIENYDYLELDVLDTNPRAIAIYERLGFVTFRETTISPALKKLYGYERRIFMYHTKRP